MESKKDEKEAELVDYEDASPFKLPDEEANPEIEKKEPLVDPAAEKDERSVFVKNIHFTCTKLEIEEHFNECGTINLVTILKDKFT